MCGIIGYVGSEDAVPLIWFIYMAANKRLEIDKPQNLAKSVTVE